MAGTIDLGGLIELGAAPAQVWAALNDPAILARCIGGCEDLERLSETEFRARLRVGVGPLAARYAAALEVVHVAPPRRYRLVAVMQARLFGDAGGAADVELEPVAAGTVLRYSARVHASGRLAGIGLELVEGAADRYLQRFFDRLTGCLRGPEGQPETGAGGIQ